MRIRTVAVLLVAAACARPDSRPEASGESEPVTLAGTSWQLLQFEGGDGTVLTPDDPSQYTMAFDADSGVSVRIDCNRGHGSWRSSPPSGLEFGPLVITRMACPPGSLHDQILRQWPYVRSYIIKDGHLYLSLMADGGIYEFEPIASQGSTGG